MLTIKSFLLLSIFILLGFLVIVSLGRRNSINNTRNILIVFGVLGLCGALTVKSYLYPRNEDVFNNSAYHILEHHGFRANDSLILVDSEQPQKALWDDKLGQVKIWKDSIILHKYTEPFYISTDMSQKKGRKFILVNNSTNIDVSREGVCISKVVGSKEDILFQLRIEEVRNNDNKKETLYIHEINGKVDTSAFRKRINHGYPLLDIVARCPKLTISQELQEILEGTYLAREELNIEDGFGRVNANRKNRSELAVVPGPGMLHNTSIRINGEEIEHPIHTITYSGKTLIQSGIGKSATSIYRIFRTIDEGPKDNTINLMYVLPTMQSLHKDGGRFFMTSYVENVLNDFMDGGYYYNLLDTDDNYNHINAEFSFNVGPSTEGLQLEVLDFYSKDGDKMMISANEEFTLSSRDPNVGINWIFNIHDMRATNDIQYKNIFLFIFLFIFLVGLRIVLDSLYSRPKTVSVIELAVYVIILTLCTIKLILAWRVTTFVPLEEITPSVFNVMKRGGKILYYTYGFAFVFPVVMIFISLCREKLWWKSAKEWLEKLLEFGANMVDSICSYLKIKNSPFNLYVILCAIGIGVCFLLATMDAIPALERFINIPIPILIYFFTDFRLALLQMSNGEEQEGTNALPYRLVCAAISFVYLLLQDPGFAIIFLVFLFLQHAVIGSLISPNFAKHIFGSKLLRKYEIRTSPVKQFIVSAFCAVILFFVLKYEGSLMICVFEKISYISIIVLISIIAILAYIALKKAKGKWKNLWWSFVAGVLCLTTFEVVGLIVDDPQIGIVSREVGSKIHMKYRAEVQKLSGDKKIDDLIKDSAYDSVDAEYIMRSAHNQWFINQYLKAGSEIKGKYFALQPHSHQGSPFPTQTTDLVITRYVIAEHGTFVVFLFMTMFLLLILIYCFEVKLRSDDKRVLLGALTLLYSIALMVFLSATNRIVFVGQDFPFISIQSLLAIAFPIAIFFLVILPIYLDKANNTKIEADNNKVHNSKWYIVASLGGFSLLCLCIEQQGKNQIDDNDCFNLSALVQDISQRVESLDKSFTNFQLDTKTYSLPIDSVWTAYVQAKEFSKEFHEICNANYQEHSSDAFFKGLLEYFDTKQPLKNDPDELLHSRRRNGLWHLSTNKRYYFINSDIRETLQWKGNLLAASNERFFNLTDERSGEVRALRTQSENHDFDYNILPKEISSNNPNITISRFDKSWSNTGSPLLLVSASQAKAKKTVIDIKTKDYQINGSLASNFIATLIKDGDLLLIRSVDSKGEDTPVLSWRYGRNNDNFLAKNIWMNGSQRLFYPLGKESIWTYQFANAVSSIFGDSTELRDASLRISLDYDLHKSFYDMLSRQNVSKYGLDEASILALQTFEALPFDKMRSKNNGTPFYFDESVNKLVCKDEKLKRKGSVINTLKAINNNYRQSNSLDTKDKMSTAIDKVIVRSYDFTAVAIDGNGRIRLLFDHTKTRGVDPNNIRHFNKFVRDLYLRGNNATERDVFGNKSLQLLPSGPGSTFKPILYTAVTSQEKLNWESLNVDPKSYGATKNTQVGENRKFDYYGGVELSQPLSLDAAANGYQYNNYLKYSNNVYHSVITLLGMQAHGELEAVFKPASTTPNQYAFPRVQYNGRWYGFNPEVWYDKFDVEKGVLNEGLYRNFRIQQEMTNKHTAYTNYFGEDEKFKLIFQKAGDKRGWTYAETGSQNTQDRMFEPKIRNGFNQMLLGAYPLQVSPLQMAEITMRLATLNRAEHLTTLDDGRVTPPDYELFKMDRDWSEDDFLKFYQRQVLSQLGDIKTMGSVAASVSKKLEKQGYYFYAKTGTLNDVRDDATQNSRIKHLLVIISNKDLRKVRSLEELRQVKTYSIYLSFMGVGEKEFSSSMYRPFIYEIVASETFKKYMEGE